MSEVPSVAIFRRAWFSSVDNSKAELWSKMREPVLLLNFPLSAEQDVNRSGVENSAHSSLNSSSVEGSGRIDLSEEGEVKYSDSNRSRIHLVTNGCLGDGEITIVPLFWIDISIIGFCLFNLGLQSVKMQLLQVHLRWF